MAKGYAQGQQRRMVQMPVNPLAIKTKKYALDKNKFITLNMSQMVKNQWYWGFVPLGLIAVNAVLNITGIYHNYWIYVLTLIELLPQPVPNLGSNFQACPGLPFTVNLNNFTDYTSVLWSDNTAGPTFNGIAPTNGNVTVSVDVAINTCTASDQVTISAYVPPVWDLGVGLTTCGDAPYTYNSTQNVLWQDGSFGNSYTQNNPVIGIETLTAVLTYGNNCIITDQVDVNVLPPFVVDLPNTADFCEGGFVTINAGNDVYWSTGEFGPSVNCSTVGTLTATYDDGYCYSQDAMEITMTYLPFIDWGDSTTYCQGQAVILGTIGSHATSFNWSTGETSEMITVTEPGYYSLTAANSCGSAFRDVVLDFESCEAYAFIPNAFTPDQDGINEAWVPVLYNAKSYEVYIYNRWGDLIFHSKDPNENREWQKDSC